jgi:hypothetical protein
MNPLKWILKYRRGGGQDSNFEPYSLVVKLGEGWVDLEPLLFTICWVAKWVNFLLDRTKCAFYLTNIIKNILNILLEHRRKNSYEINILFIKDNI